MFSGCATFSLWPFNWVQTAKRLISQSTVPPPEAKRIKLFRNEVQEAEDGANFGRHVLSGAKKGSAMYASNDNMASGR